METYNVFYLVSGDSEETQNISDTASFSFDAEDLDDLFEILRKGEEDDSIQPELEIGVEIEGDFRIECVLIYDADGKEVFREKGFMEQDHSQ